jgi:hypothetical protein
MVNTNPSGSAQFERADEFDMQTGIGVAIGSLSTPCLYGGRSAPDNGIVFGHFVFAGRSKAETFQPEKWV